MEQREESHLCSMMQLTPVTSTILLLKVSPKLHIAFTVHPGMNAFFIRNHFIRNLHVEGRNIQGTYTTKGKIPKELFIFKIRVLYSDTSED